jgi:hypothetical protein
MANCPICGLTVSVPGKECHRCYKDQFITYVTGVKGLSNLGMAVKDYEFEQARRDWEESLPGLFVTGRVI